MAKIPTLVTERIALRNQTKGGTMMDENKRNLHFFSAHTLHALYESLQLWQDNNKTRFLSLNIHPQDDGYGCIALTNPSEVVIVARDGINDKYKEVERCGNKLQVKTH